MSFSSRKQILWVVSELAFDVIADVVREFHIPNFVSFSKQFKFQTVRYYFYVMPLDPNNFGDTRAEVIQQSQEEPVVPRTRRDALQNLLLVHVPLDTNG